MKRFLIIAAFLLAITASLVAAGPPPPFIFPPQTSSGSMVYPGAGVPSSTGAGWDASYTLDTDLTSVSASDDSLPSAKATKAYADTKRVFSGAATALTADSATPALTSGTWFYKTANTTGTTYTNFTGGSAGWHILVLVDDSNSTFDFTASSLNNAYGVDYPAASGDLIECIHNGTNWTCLIWGNNAATSLPTPTAITVADEAADATSFPLFVTAPTGDLGPKTDTAFTYDPTTGNLGVTGITVGSGGITQAATATPTDTFLDSDAPGTDKEIAKLVGGYVDGADGAENGTLDLNVHVAGSTTSYIQLDGKNTRIELNADLLVDTTKKLQFGDTGTYINQSTDGTLNIVADTIGQIVAPNIKLAFDAAAYLNVATADGGGTTISQVSDGADLINIGDSSDDMVRVRMTLNATNETWSGNTLYFAQCAASMGFGAPAYIQSTGKPGLADADAAATMPAIGLVVVASTDADTPCTILTHGVITDTDWNWTPGNTIYVADGDAGAITATLADISDTDDVVQVIGIAIHADSIFVSPSLTTITLE